MRGMEWRVIASHPAYEVSSAGEVRHGQRVLKGRIQRGYLRLQLGRHNEQYIHRLVADAFIPNPENKREVDHINRVKTDNRVENLRWASRSENQENLNVQSNNKLGHKNISIWRRGGYIVQIRRDGVAVYAKRFKDLDEAIMERDLFLLFL